MTDFFTRTFCRNKRTSATGTKPGKTAMDIPQHLLSRSYLKWSVDKDGYPPTAAVMTENGWISADNLGRATRFRDKCPFHSCFTFSSCSDLTTFHYSIWSANREQAYFQWKIVKTDKGFVIGHKPVNLLHKGRCQV